MNPCELELDETISSDRAMEVAKSIGSSQLEATIQALLDTKPIHENDSLSCDQFLACFAQATEDVADDTLYFAVRNTYDVVPLPRKVKAMLSNLHNQCMLRGANFTPGEVRELCDKVSLSIPLLFSQPTQSKSPSVTNF